MSIILHPNFVKNCLESEELLKLPLMHSWSLQTMDTRHWLILPLNTIHQIFLALDT